MHKISTVQGIPLLDFHPNERDLSFQVPDVCAKFHQNPFKIVTVREHTNLANEYATPEGFHKQK